MSDIRYYLVAMSKFENDFYDAEEDSVRLDGRLSELILQACRDDQLDFSDYHHSLLVTEACQVLGYATDIASLRTHWPDYAQQMTSAAVEVMLEGSRMERLNS